jgi:hypothetical protein
MAIFVAIVRIPLTTIHMAMENESTPGSGQDTKAGNYNDTPMTMGCWLIRSKREH